MLSTSFKFKLCLPANYNVGRLKFVPVLRKLKDVVESARWISLSTDGRLQQKSSDFPNDGNSDTLSEKMADMSVSVQGLQGKQPHNFSPAWAREVITDAMNKPDIEHVQQGVQGGSELVTGQMEGVPTDAYRHSSNVSLYSVMQSNVPHPYSKNPTHLNMPSGGDAQQQKYVSGMLQGTHPSRQFSTISDGHKQPYDDVLFPQGIQGEDCDQFKLWMKNCQQFNLSGCEDQLKSLNSGQKTLSQVLSEQEQLMRQIVLDYNKNRRSSQPGYDDEDANLQGVQDVAARRPQFLSGDESGYSVQGSLETSVPSEVLLAYDSPCPQGVQGSDCHQFKLWLENCIKFGIRECAEDFRQFQTGRKTLAMIFEEQERHIHEVAEFYRSQQGKLQEVSTTYTAARMYSTSSHNVPESDSKVSPKAEGARDNLNSPKLSQKERLKRAVKEYGGTVIVFHIGISLISLGGFYLAVTSGLDVVAILQKMGVGERLLQSSLAAGASTFVIAYAVHKVFAPVRIAITLTSTPFIVRYLRRVGILKPPKVKTN